MAGLKIGDSLAEGVKHGGEQMKSSLVGSAHYYDTIFEYLKGKYVQSPIKTAKKNQAKTSPKDEDEQVMAFEGEGTKTLKDMWGKTPETSAQRKARFKREQADQKSAAAFFKKQKTKSEIIANFKSGTGFGSPGLPTLNNVAPNQIANDGSYQPLTDDLEPNEERPLTDHSGGDSKDTKQTNKLLTTLVSLTKDAVKNTLTVEAAGL